MAAILWILPPAIENAEPVNSNRMSGMVKHVLLCGLGSIGRRHLRHLREYGVSRIDAWRTGLATLPDEGQSQPDCVFRSLDEALAARPEAVVVANPTSLHLQTAVSALRAGCHVLIEKPLSHSMEGLQELRSLAKQRVVAIGCNLRFHPLLRMVWNWTHGLSPLGAPRHARLHFHAFLPAWHPWEDYRQSYAARRDLGGGAALTHIHEIDYALWLFGPAAAFVGMQALGRPLGTDVDESTGLMIQHVGGVRTDLSLSLDTRPPSRGFEIVFDEGTLKGDLISGGWSMVRADGSKSEGGVDQGFDIDQTYRLQLEAFIAAIEGRRLEPEVGLEEAIAALRIALYDKDLPDTQKAGHARQSF